MFATEKNKTKNLSVCFHIMSPAQFTARDRVRPYEETLSRCRYQLVAWRKSSGIYIAPVVPCTFPVWDNSLTHNV